MNTDELKQYINGRRIVASISGGKDSAAMSLYLMELGIEHDRVFMDTGWEHEKTYQYLRGELTRVIGPVVEIRGTLPMTELIQKKGMFPSRLMRFCTQELKVYPMQKFLARLVDEGHDCINAVGIRRTESASRSKMTEWEWSEGFDCEVWRPIITWSEEEVIAIHRRHGLPPNPLYLEGASRVGCWPCIHARKDEIRLVAIRDPKRIDEIRALEKRLTDAGEARYAADGKTFESQGYMRPTFFQTRASGRPSAWPIDDVVDWCRTTRGGNQIDLFSGVPDDGDGCMRWGLCDTEGGRDGKD